MLLCLWIPLMVGKSAELIERRTLDSFSGQTGVRLHILTLRWSGWPVSRMSEAAGRLGFRTNSTGCQDRSGHFCTGTWRVSYASRPGASWHFSHR
jgi:hypothetical protein